MSEPSGMIQGIKYFNTMLTPEQMKEMTESNMETPEAKVKKKVRDILKAYPVFFFSPVTGGYGSSGIPDIVCCVNGHFLAIECKAGKGQVTALQARALNKIQEKGGTALVINENNMAELVAVLEELCMTK